MLSIVHHMRIVLALRPFSLAHSLWHRHKARTRYMWQPVIFSNIFRKDVIWSKRETCCTGCGCKGTQRSKSARCRVWRRRWRWRRWRRRRRGRRWRWRRCAAGRRQVGRALLHHPPPPLCCARLHLQQSSQRALLLECGPTTLGWGRALGEGRLRRSGAGPGS